MGTHAPVTSAFRATASGNRLDWPAIRDRVDMAKVATALLGPAPGRRGERGRRLWWPCPFHEDKNPSFVIDPGKPYWRCYGCGEHGDAANLVMRLQGVGFPEAVAYLAGKPAPSGKPARPRHPAASPAKAPGKSPEEASGLPLADALALIADAEQRLWTPEGTAALEYLRRDRGLTEATIRQARLGRVRSVMIPKADGVGFFKASGVSIPWHDAGGLTLAKIRQPEGSRPRYAEAFRDRPEVFPSMESIRPGLPLVIVEGEFDALLLGQELAGLASVITTGSASNGPSGRILLAALASPRWFAAHDADPAGDKAATLWPARAIRVRPPAGKDWTDCYRAGIDLRRWWVEEHFADEFDRQERAAIFEFDAGLTRLEAERAAGLRMAGDVPESN
jgi:DNA primase